MMNEANNGKGSKMEIREKTFKAEVKTNWRGKTKVVTVTGDLIITNMFHAARRGNSVSYNMDTGILTFESVDGVYCTVEMDFVDHNVLEVAYIEDRKAIGKAN